MACLSERLYERSFCSSKWLVLCSKLSQALSQTQLELRQNKAVAICTRGDHLQTTAHAQIMRASQSIVLLCFFLGLSGVRLSSLSSGCFCVLCCFQAARCLRWEGKGCFQEFFGPLDDSGCQMLRIPTTNLLLSAQIIRIAPLHKRTRLIQVPLEPFNCRPTHHHYPRRYPSRRPRPPWPCPWDRLQRPLVLMALPHPPPSPVVPPPVVGRPLLGLRHLLQVDMQYPITAASKKNPFKRWLGFQKTVGLTMIFVISSDKACPSDRSKP